MLAGDGTKQQKFERSVSTLHSAVQWGTPVTAADLVDPALYPVFYQKMAGDPRKMKVVDIAIGEVLLDKPAEDQALMTADIRVYGPPNYAVKTLTRREKWQYSRFGGWKLIDIEELPSSADQ